MSVNIRAPYSFRNTTTTSMTVLLTYSRSSKDRGGTSLEFTQKDLNHVRYDKNTVEKKEFHLDVAGWRRAGTACAKELPTDSG